MTFERLLVIGAGGQGKVVIDAVRGAKSPCEIVIADEDERKNGHLLLGCRIAAPLANALASITYFHVAVGHNATRERIAHYLEERGLTNLLISHPRAYISEAAKIGRGVFIAANGVVGPDALVEPGCIINHGAVIDHDCYVGAYSHIAPGVTLGGGVRVGRRVLVGAGANILPGVSIGDDCVVGAGSVVLNDLEPGSVHVGVPARKYK